MKKNATIEITIINKSEEEIPNAEVLGFITNLAYTYNTQAVRAGNAFYIEIKEDLGELKGIGLMHQFYQTYHETFREIVTQFTRAVKFRGQDSTQISRAEKVSQQKAIFSARILSPLINVHVPFIEAVNFLFSRLHFGFYMEVINGGFVFYVNDRHGFDFITRFFDPKVVDYVRGHQDLLQSDPKSFFATILNIVGLGFLPKAEE